MYLYTNNLQDDIPSYGLCMMSFAHLDVLQFSGTKLEEMNICVSFDLLI